MQVFAIGQTATQSLKKDSTKNKALTKFSAFDALENFFTLQILNPKFKIVSSNNIVIYPTMRAWVQLSFHTCIKISVALWQVFPLNS